MANRPAWGTVVGIEAEVVPNPIVLGSAALITTRYVFEDGQTAEFAATRASLNYDAATVGLADITHPNIEPKRTGTGWVEALFDGFVARADFEVTVGTSSVVAVIPAVSDQEISIGDHIPLGAQIEYVDGTLADGGDALTWSLSNATTATIADGELVGWSQGIVTVFARHEEAWNSVVVVVR